MTGGGRSTRGGPGALVVALATATAAGVSGPGCSLALDFGAECNETSVCPDGLECEQGFCVRARPSPQAELQQGPCKSLLGVPAEQALSADTVLLGSVLPLTGSLGAYGGGMQQAVALAVDEINGSGGIGGKKLGVLACDSASTPEVARAAARHLVSAARVPAIVGPASSNVVIDVLGSVALSSGVVLMSPAARSAAITNLADDGLLWRTAPSDVSEGPAIAALLLSRGYGRVALVSRDDDYGAGLRDAIESDFCASFACDDGDQYLARTYNTAGATQADLLEQLAAFAPDVLVLVSFLADGTGLLRLLSGDADDVGTALPAKPDFIVTGAMRSRSLIAALSDCDVLCRLAGTSPQLPSAESPESGAVYAAFRTRFEAAYGTTDNLDAAQAYDALYLLAYAIAAAQAEGSGELTGRAVAGGLTRLSSGVQVQVGPIDLGTAIDLLGRADGGTVDVLGASGPLDFDSRGDPAVDVEAWVVDLGQSTVESVGVIYSHDGTYKFDAAAEQTLRGRGAACEGG